MENESCQRGSEKGPAAEQATKKFGHKADSEQCLGAKDVLPGLNAGSGAEWLLDSTWAMQSFSLARAKDQKSREERDSH